MKRSFMLARKRLARNLQNPRLLKISFHTFRALEGNDGIPQNERSTIC